MGRFKERIARGLDLPSEVAVGSYRVEITPGLVEIENFKGVMEYEEGFLKVKMGEKVVSIEGGNLEILEMTDDTIQVKGEVGQLTIKN